MERVQKPAQCDTTQYTPTPDAEIEAWLASHPEEAEDVAKYESGWLKKFTKAPSESNRKTARRLALRLAYALAHSRTDGKIHP